MNSRTEENQPGGDRPSETGFDSAAFLRTVPDLPGVYRMYNSRDQIIYVGKAKNLHNRVNQYFTGAHDFKTTKLVSEIEDFDFIVRTLLKTSKYSFAENSEIDYLYRQGHTGTITSNFTANGKYESTLYLFSKTMEELSSLQDSEIRKKQYYGFFKLQLEKVALSGTKEELREYFRFVRKYYGFPYSIKLSIAKLLLRGPFVNNQKYKKKYVHFIVALLYHPSAFVDKIRKK